MNNTVKGVYCHAEATATAVTSLSADNKRYLEEPWQPHNLPDMVTKFERTMERVLQKYANQVSTSHGVLAQIESVRCMSNGMAEHNTPNQELNAALPRPHHHTKLDFLCRTSVLTVSRTTSIPNMQLEE